MMGENSLDRRWVGWISSSGAWYPSPVDCTLEEACRLRSARTDDRSFVAHAQ